MYYSKPSLENCTEHFQIDYSIRTDFLELISCFFIENRGIFNLI